MIIYGNVFITQFHLAKSLTYEFYDTIVFLMMPIVYTHTTHTIIAL